ncbi:hypothetical protein WH96_06560 [Kiloniella spongiae]|uniref:Uncharacterized protein n=1 Tax=Kiloniella spongiae TaxID=1489064 RepID=A0A0H2MG10_9PROT|nr:hypothetical protein [Kiloniella spongiae]KLN61308.1 hypothetical protein WH96_06560 [Kiloniella spongiae]
MSKRRYAVHKVTIGANQSEKVTIRGNVVACIEAPTAFLLGFEDDTPSLFYQGFSVKADEGETFDYIRVENEANAPIEITLAVGFGDIRDSRLSLTGVLQANVINFPVVAEKDKPGIVPLGEHSASFTAAGGNFFHNLINPSVNVNGIIIRQLSMIAYGNWSVLAFDTVSPATAYANASKFRRVVAIGDSAEYHNMYLEAGLGVWAKQLTNQLYASINYDIL